MFFVHNTWKKPKLVVETCKKEMEYYPDSSFCVVYNSDVKIEEDNIQTFYFGENKGHKLGCMNAVMGALVLGSESNHDLIVFSHDDIYLQNNEKFKRSLDLMRDYDFVGRRYNIPPYTSYIMMESFIMKRSLATQIVKDYTHNSIDTLPLDDVNSECPELLFGEYIKNFTSNIFTFDFTSNYYGENEMGYYHIESKRGSYE